MSQALTYLRELMQKVAARQAADDARQIGARYIMAHTGEHHFLLDIQCIAKVLEVAQVSDVPNTKPWVIGLTNHQGALLPVLDLGLWLGLPATAPAQRVQTRWLLLEQAGEQLIFSIQADAGLIEINKFTAVTEANLPASCEPFVKLKCVHQTQDCYVLELKNMLDCCANLNLFMDKKESTAHVFTHPEKEKVHLE